jgi:hypothetical protein
MKYKDFCTYLHHKVKNNAYIGPSISMIIPCFHEELSSKVVCKISEKVNINLLQYRFIIFPLKIYGENIKHLNILLLDQNTKILERFEPFNRHLNFYQVNGILESFLYKLMEENLIYFLKYKVTLNAQSNIDEKSCGLYCIDYVSNKVKLKSLKSNEAKSI